MGIREIDTKTQFEGCNTVMLHVGLADCKIGYMSYIGNDTILFKTDIGRFCSIADNVSIIFGNIRLLSLLLQARHFTLKRVFPIRAL